MTSNYKQVLLGMVALVLFGIFVSTDEAQVAIAGIVYVCYLQMSLIKKEDRAGKRIWTLLCLLLVVGLIIGITLLAHTLLFDDELLSGYILMGLTLYGSLCLAVGMTFLLLQELFAVEVQKVMLTIGLMYLIFLTYIARSIVATIPDDIPAEYHYQIPWDLVCIAMVTFGVGCVLECIISHWKHRRDDIEMLDV